MYDVSILKKRHEKNMELLEEEQRIEARRRRKEKDRLDREAEKLLRRGSRTDEPRSAGGWLRAALKFLAV